MRAVWNGAILAESEETIVVEGNHYFSPASIKEEFFRQSDLHTTCPWKGQASYWDVAVGDEANEGAAWYYPDPLSAANEIKDYVAFWRGVEIEP